MRLCKFQRAIAVALAIVMAMSAGPIGLARAKMVTTDQVIDVADPAHDRAKVESFILRDDVQRQLVLLGIDPEEAAGRVGSLSDREIQEIAGRLDELPAGQGAVGAIVGAAVLIFLVLLITDLLGLTDVFPFVKKQAR